jgi:hypothetical protein
MKLNYKTKLLLLVISTITSFSSAQVPSIEWQKSLGGTLFDTAWSIQQTTDGGYIVAGETQSNDGNVTGNHSGERDIWITKLNSDGGVIEWQKAYGGVSNEFLTKIKQTSDGGYIIVGYTESNNGDVTVNHGGADGWIIKINATGDIQWQKTYGGTFSDVLTDIYQLSDGSYIASGGTASNNGDVTGNHGIFDAWVVKISATGILQWNNVYGGTNFDYFSSIKISTDGGYILAGQTQSNNGNVSGNHGASDFWIVKISNTGVLQWQKALGGSQVDIANSIENTNDGGYIVAGKSDSNNGNVTGNQGFDDVWVVKLNATGVIQWQKTYGGTSTEGASSIHQTTDGGYIIGAGTFSFSGDVIGSHGEGEFWLVKINNTGTIQWQKTLGGTSFDYANDMQKTTDGGYILTGESSSNDGDVTGNNGSSDYWVVKLAPDNLGNTNFTDNKLIKLFPNPAKEKMTLKLDYFTPSQEISINDIQGKIIHNQKVEGLSTTINTSIFEKGIYFLNLVDGTQKTTILKP